MTRRTALLRSAAMRGLLTIAALSAAMPAYGQVLPAAPEGLDVAVASRLRYEAIEGQARAGVPASEASTQLRTILHATWRRGAFTIGGELFDSRAFDVPSPTAISTNEVNALEPVQAFASLDWGDAARGRLHGRITLGRQTADLRSRRLLANDDYRNTTNGFTGIRVDVADGARWNATAFYLLPQQRLPEDAAGLRRGRVTLDREGFDKRVWGVTAARLAIVGGIGGDIGMYRFEERDRPGLATRDRQLTTLTARALAPAAPGQVDGEVEVMRQTGSIAASLAAGAGRLPVEAWFAHAELGYQWKVAWSPHLVVEGDYASGDERDGRYRRFDTLYGMRRADYSGAGLYNAISRGNLIALGPRLEVTPSKRTDAFATVKKLWLASSRDAFATTGVVDATGQSGRDAGWQIDARVRYWAVPKRLQLEVDGTWLAKGRFLRQAPNRVSDRDTLYLALNATAFF